MREPTPVREMMSTVGSVTWEIATVRIVAAVLAASLSWHYRIVAPDFSDLSRVGAICPVRWLLHFVVGTPDCSRDADVAQCRVSRSNCQSKLGYVGSHGEHRDHRVLRLIHSD